MPTLDADRLLEVQDIRAGYGKIEILHQVSLHLREREIVTVIGPNGAGKSTVLKTIMGYIRPTQGSIIFRDETITGEEAHTNIARGLGYVPQGRITFPQMTVLENLEMGGFLVRDRRRLHEGYETVFTIFPRLAERKNQLAGTLSGGEQQMVAIGRAMMHQPRCILLDEPSLGLSPKFVDLVFDKLTEMRSLGLTLLLVEQNAARALGISDRAYVLDLGRNRATGPATELLADPEIKMMFIGR